MSRDWVVQPETWISAVQEQPAYITGVGSTFALPLTVNGLNWINAPQAIDQMQRFREAQTAQLAMASYGDVAVTIIPEEASGYDDVFANSWKLVTHLRITRLVSDPNSQDSAIAGGYDMRDPAVANDSFVWHSIIHWTNLTSTVWITVPAQRTPITQTRQVRARYRRRLEGTENMYLLCQTGVVTTDVNITQYFPIPELRVWYQPYIRTLLAGR